MSDGIRDWVVLRLSRHRATMSFWAGCVVGDVSDGGEKHMLAEHAGAYDYHRGARDVLSELLRLMDRRGHVRDDDQD
jgi:hypothetical protein